MKYKSSTKSITKSSAKSITKSNAKSITKSSEKIEIKNYKSSVFTQSATQHLQAIDARSKSILKIKIDYKKLMVRQLINKIS